MIQTTTLADACTASSTSAWCWWMSHLDSEPGRCPAAQESLHSTAHPHNGEQSAMKGGLRALARQRAVLQTSTSTRQQRLPPHPHEVLWPPWPSAREAATLKQQPLRQARHTASRALLTVGCHPSHPNGSTGHRRRGGLLNSNLTARHRGQCAPQLEWAHARGVAVLREPGSPTSPRCTHSSPCSSNLIIIHRPWHTRDPTAAPGSHMSSREQPGMAALHQPVSSHWEARWPRAPASVPRVPTLAVDPGQPAERWPSTSRPWHPPDVRLAQHNVQPNAGNAMHR